MLNTLFIRGRHMMISTLVSTQKLRLIGSTVRVNAQFVLCWRLRNALELEALIEELSAVYTKKQLLEMFETATAEPYSFWYSDLTAKTKENMFWLRFEKRMVPVKRLDRSSGSGGGELVDSSPPPQSQTDVEVHCCSSSTTVVEDESEGEGEATPHSRRSGGSGTPLRRRRRTSSVQFFEPPGLERPEAGLAYSPCVGYGRGDVVYPSFRGQPVQDERQPLRLPVPAAGNGHGHGSSPVYQAR